MIHRDTGLRADVYLAGDDFHAWALERRRRISVETLDVWLAPLEYLREWSTRRGVGELLEEARAFDPG